MTAPVFVDTNVLLYAMDTADAEKHRAASAWRVELWKSRRGRLSYQVLQEFYVQAVRKNPQGADAAEAEVRDLFAWDPVVVDAAVLEAAWRLRRRYSLSFWDALVVGAANYTFTLGSYEFNGIVLGSIGALVSYQVLRLLGARGAGR